MKYRKYITWVSFLFLTATFNVEAGLTSYTSDGKNLVYSSLSNVTWTSNANLLGTMEETEGFNNLVNKIIASSPIIYDIPNYFDGSFGNHDGPNGREYTGSYTITFQDFNANTPGLTSWFGAMAFTNYLSSIEYAGSSHWRLPNEYDEYGELMQLFYMELLGTSSDSFRQATEFTNQQTSAYWSSTESIGSHANNAWYVYPFYAGKLPINKTYQLYALAVTPGQISEVPLINSAWLMGSGLLSLFSIKLRRSHAGWARFLCPRGI